MKKIVATSIIMSSLLFGQTVEERLEALEKAHAELKKENTELKSLMSKSEVSDKIDAVDERLEGIETIVLKNKLSLGLGIKNRVENFKGTMADGTKYSDNNIWSSKFMINLNADIADNLKFSGRLSMYKYWADSVGNQMASVDYMQGRAPNDSGLYVERAYIDWLIAKGDIPLTLTIGRQPSSDGPSHHFKEDTTRKSTYSALSFDGAADGVVATVGLSNLTGLKDTAVRFAYGKSFQNKSTDQNALYMGVKTDTLKDTDVVGVFIDSSIPGVDNSLVQVGYVKAKDIIPNPFDLSANNANIGDLALAGIALEAQNIAGTSIDAFAQYGISKATPNGVLYNMGAMGSYGLLTNMAGDTETKTGHSIWLGARYTLPFETKSKVGIEYNRGSQNWISFTPAPNDLTNKLAIRGSATEVYYIHPLNRFSNLRAGALAMDYKYTGSGNYVGASMDLDTLPAGMKGMYLDKLLNYYLQLNVLF